MKILHTDHQLHDEIINDAQNKAENILKKAQKKAEEIALQADAEIIQLEEELNKQFTESLTQTKKIYFASIDLEVQKKILQLTGDYIDQIFTEIQNKISTNELFDYHQIISKLIRTAAEMINDTQYHIEISQIELNHLTQDFFKKLKLNKGEIVDTVVKNNLKEGLILYSSDKKISAHISLDKFFSMIKEQERFHVHHLLFQGIKNER